MAFLDQTTDANCSLIRIWYSFVPLTNHQLFNRAPLVPFSTEHVDSERLVLGSIDPSSRDTPVSTCSLLRV